MFQKIANIFVFEETLYVIGNRGIVCEMPFGMVIEVDHRKFSQVCIRPIGTVMFYNRCAIPIVKSEQILHTVPYGFLFDQILLEPLNIKVEIHINHLHKGLC